MLPPNRGKNAASDDEKSLFINRAPSSKAVGEGGMKVFSRETGEWGGEKTPNPFYGVKTRRLINRWKWKNVPAKGLTAKAVR